MSPYQNPPHGSQFAPPSEYPAQGRSAAPEQGPAPFAPPSEVAPPLAGSPTGANQAIEHTEPGAGSDSGDKILSRRRFLLGAGAFVAGAALDRVASKLPIHLLEDQNTDAAPVDITTPPKPANTIPAGLSPEQHMRIKRLQQGQREDIVSTEELVDSYRPFGERLPGMEPVGAELSRLVRQEISTFPAVGPLIDTEVGSITYNSTDISSLRDNHPEVFDALRITFDQLCTIAQSHPDLARYMGNMLQWEPYDASTNSPEMRHRQRDPNEKIVNALDVVTQRLTDPSLIGSPIKGAGPSVEEASAKIGFEELVTRHNDPADMFKFSDHIVANFFLHDQEDAEHIRQQIREQYDIAKNEVMRTDIGRNAPSSAMMLMNNMEMVPVDYLQRFLHTDGQADYLKNAGLFDVYTGVIVIECPRTDVGIKDEDIREVARHEILHELSGFIFRRASRNNSDFGGISAPKRGMITRGAASDVPYAPLVGRGMEEQVTQYQADRVGIRSTDSSTKGDKSTGQSFGVYNTQLLDTLAYDLGSAGVTTGMAASMGEHLFDPKLLLEYKQADRSNPEEVPSADGVGDAHTEFDYQRTRRQMVQAINDVYGKGFYNRLVMFMDKVAIEDPEGYGNGQIAGLIQAILIDRGDREADDKQMVYGREKILMPGREAILAASVTPLGETRYVATNNFINEYLATEPVIPQP